MSRGNYNIHVHFVFNNSLFWKSYCIWGIVEKYWKTGQATSDNRTNAYCVKDNQSDTHTHTHTHARQVTHFFSTATMVARTDVSITLYYIACIVLFRHDNVWVSYRHNLPRTCFGHLCDYPQEVDKICRRHTVFMIWNILVSVYAFVCTVSLSNQLNL